MKPFVVYAGEVPVTAGDGIFIDATTAPDLVAVCVVRTDELTYPKLMHAEQSFDRDMAVSVFMAAVLDDEAAVWVCPAEEAEGKVRLLEDMQLTAVVKPALQHLEERALKRKSRDEAIEGAEGG